MRLSTFDGHAICFNVHLEILDAALSTSHLSMRLQNCGPPPVGVPFHQSDCHFLRASRNTMLALLSLDAAEEGIQSKTKVVRAFCHQLQVEGLKLELHLDSIFLTKGGS